MASLVYSEQQDTRRSLSIETPPSSSPFPSPSSSFLPPPRMGAHEFAVKPPPPGKSTARRKSIPKKDEQASSFTSPTTVPDVPSMPINHVNGSGGAVIVNGNGTRDDHDEGPTLATEVLSPQTPTQATSATATATASSALALSSSPLSSALSPDDNHPRSGCVTPTNTTTPPLTADDATLQSNFVSDTTSTTIKEAPSFQTYPASPPATTTTFSHAHSNSTSSATSTYEAGATTPLTSTRPAPPSPAISRRASGAPSIASSTSSTPSRAARHSSSRPTSISSPISRANSTRKGKQQQQQLLGVGDLTMTPTDLTGESLTLSGLPPPQSKPPSSFTAPISTTATSASVTAVPSTSSSLGAGSAPVVRSSSPSPATAAATTLSNRPAIKIRDFAFDDEDVRHVGLGPSVPKPNRVSRLLRSLRTRKVATDEDGWEDVDDDDEDDDEKEAEEEAEGWGNGIGAAGGGFKFGMGRFSWGALGGFGATGGFGMKTAEAAAAMDEDAGGRPSRGDLERNFLDQDVEEDNGEGVAGDADDEELFADADEDFPEDVENEEEEPLYPGLYRAVYAFEPEGTAEMALEEDQIVRVIGRGGGVGWAVVIKSKESPTESDTHALVPESYLEPVKLDWENENEE